MTEELYGRAWEEAHPDFMAWAEALAAGEEPEGTRVLYRRPVDAEPLEEDAEPS